MTSYSTLVTTAGSHLIDLSLYVSSKNYTSLTRTQYSSIQPWPSQYISPPHLRNRARARTAHLGLTGLDVDVPERPPATTDTIIPPKKTLAAQLKDSERTALFQLDGLVRSLLDPLLKLIEGTGKGKKYIFSDNDVSTLDCLVLGYLSLGLYPPVPHAWYSSTLSLPEYTPVRKLVEELKKLCFGSGPILSSEAFKTSEETTSLLPWDTTVHQGITPLNTIGTLLRAALPDIMPLKRKAAPSDPPAVVTQDPSRLTTVLQVGTLIGGVVVAAGYSVYRSNIEPEKAPESIPVEEFIVNEKAEDFFKTGLAGL
jgi:sorting and assembly machinery component 37